MRGLEGTHSFVPERTNSRSPSDPLSSNTLYTRLMCLFLTRNLGTATTLVMAPFPLLILCCKEFESLTTTLIGEMFVVLFSE